MKNGTQWIAAFCVAIAGMLASNVGASPVSAQAISQCECGSVGCTDCSGGRRLRLRRPCRSCQTDCGGVSCPQCEGDICKLELDTSKVKKTCFQIEQVPVCIPPVRFPWQKCCPPGTSKTRLVNKLKRHSYECPNCSYKWSVVEPGVAPQTTDPVALPPIVNAPPNITPTPVTAAPATTVFPAPPIVQPQGR